MKILLVFPDWLGKSGESCKHALELLNHEVILAYGSNNNDLTIPGKIYLSGTRLPYFGEMVRKSVIDIYNSNVVKIVERNKPDLVINNCLNLKEDTVYALRKNTKFIVAWAGDDPLLFKEFVKTVNEYDLFFSGSPSWINDQLLSYRKSHNYYLPYGYNDKIYHKINNNTENYFKSDVCFLGARYSDREKLLAEIIDYDLSIWGWKKTNAFKEIYRSIFKRKHSLFHDKYGIDNFIYEKRLDSYIKNSSVDNNTANLIYNASNIVLNLQHPQMLDAVNSKTFEISGSGAFQLLQNNNELHGLYELNKEIVCFVDIHDLKDKLKFYLRNENERKRIAQNAMFRSRSEHTYFSRMKKLLECVYKYF